MTGGLSLFSPTGADLGACMLWHAQAPEQPPIGLKLVKSASLVDLINAQLSATSAAAGPCPMVA